MRGVPTRAAPPARRLRALRGEPKGVLARGRGQSGAERVAESRLREEARRQDNLAWTCSTLGCRVTYVKSAGF